MEFQDDIELSNGIDWINALRAKMLQDRQRFADRKLLPLSLKDQVNKKKIAIDKVNYINFRT